MTVTDRDPTTGPHAGLLDWLAGHGIEYELHEHPLTFTARETAEIEGVDPRRFAKTIAVETEDGQRALVSLAASDLRRQGVRQTGRRGLPAETVLRCALLKQQRQLSYEELAFHLEDSASFRAFARLPLAWSPKKSVLHRTISALRPETWRQSKGG